MGRREIIYTDVPYINRSNVVDVLNNALPTHQSNASRIKALNDFESGVQPLTRIKTYRKDIDVCCVDNVAHEVTKFHCGYEWGNPITLIQRGEKDSGNGDESLAIAMLNEQYEAEGIKTKTQKLGKDVTIGNLGYTHVDVNMEYEDEDGDSFFKLNCLNPLTTFVIRSSYYLDERVMAAVTYREDLGHVRHYTVFTKDTRFDISEGKITLEEMNPLGKIPIIEWIGNYDGMGIWEHEISEMNNLNLMISDFSNAVEQSIQCVWRANDVEFPTEIVKNEDGTETEKVIKPKDGEWLQTFTTQDGKTPIVEALTADYDYASQLSNIITRRQLILQKCYVPQRADGENSTGIAQSVSSGWSALDIVSESIKAIQESCKMEEVKVVLAAIKISPFVPADSPLLKLKASDIQPNIKRQKLAEMSTKINALVSMIKVGIYGQHAIQSVNYFADPNQVWEDSRPMIEKLQESLVSTKETNEKTMQDDSDQLNQSPFIDGIDIEQKE